MAKYKLKEKIIGYVDILGFSQHMRSAERGKGFTTDALFDAAKYLGTIRSRDEFSKYGPIICPQSKPISRDLDYEVTQAFDCVILSAEPSPVGAVNLVGHCWGAAMHLLTKGLLCRGYITRGQIYHRGSDVFGSGHLDVMDKEKSVSFFKRDANERGTPFIEVDPTIIELVESEGDDCSRKMFNRYVRKDEGLCAVFPFAALGHSFLIAAPGASFNPSNELASNNNLRIGLRSLRTKIEDLTDATDTKAAQKAAHYIRALDVQLNGCDETEGVINSLIRAGFGNPKDQYNPSKKPIFTSSPKPPTSK